MLLITLLACYDFEGDAGVLGFATDLYIDSGTKWTPDHDVLAGTSPSVAAMTRIGAEDDEPPPQVFGDATFEGVEAKGPELRFQGPEQGCGRVDYAGEYEDGFTMCFAPGATLEVFHPDAPDVALDEFALSEPTALHVRVVDDEGYPLGFRYGDLEVEGPGWLHESEVRLVRPGQTTVRIGPLATDIVVFDEDPGW